MIKSLLSLMYAMSVPLFGGNWNNTSSAGILNCNNSGGWSNYNNNYGVRDLLKKMTYSNECRQIVRDTLNFSLKAIKLIALCFSSNENERQARSVL